MLNFIVKNRPEIEAGFKPDGNSVLISINDAGFDAAVASTKYISTLPLFFDDVDEEGGSATVISRFDAIDILRFVNDFSHMDNIVIHCNAGQSRSAGAAAALSLIFNGEDKSIIRVKPLYNRKVYSTILNEYYVN